MQALVIMKEERNQWDHQVDSQLIISMHRVNLDKSQSNMIVHKLLIKLEILKKWLFALMSLIKEVLKI